MDVVDYFLSVLHCVTNTLFLKVFYFVLEFYRMLLLTGKHCMKGWNL